ncbi:MAG TPA: DUF4062 domain-containing protein [Bryobacteraceae bacterium]|nr:DUF4062 domain-containing protein [Bryobacteraceae bacterium]
MPREVSAYQVFIASPGGLDEERKRFREIVNEHNENHALENGVLFIPVGYEQTPRGMGRPQQLINDDLKRSDYCIFLLHDRWGSPTSKPALYSSGTEEEFSLAMELFRAGTMLDLLVFFKAVDPSRLSDPGPQLQKVLDFRRELEDGKELFPYPYSGLELFEKAVRKHLSTWMYAHLKRQVSGRLK